VAEEKGVLGVQEVTRPSAFVVAEKVRGVVAVVGEVFGVVVVESRVRTTGMLDAGRPIVVSRTWHVIGGFCDVAMLVGVGRLEAVVGVGDSCAVRA
jgi:hypothetical protein